MSSDNAEAVQLCWNPVNQATLAVVTSSGGLNTYTLKDASIEFHSLDPNLKTRCCCWSPKGKQIVAGFVNGKLMQFTPELKVAKTIDCPPGIVVGNFDTIAVQWLSTFQFAVAFASHQPESRPGEKFDDEFMWCKAGMALKARRWSRNDVDEFGCKFP